MSDTILLKGAPLAAKIKEQVSVQVEEFKLRGVVPRLAVVITVNDAAVESYLAAKQKLAKQLGVMIEVVDASMANQAELEAQMQQLSANRDIHGVILEWPARADLDAARAEQFIDQKKDIDGLTPANLGLVASGREDQAIVSACPQACLMLAQSQGPLTGKNVAVVGYGRTVGRPLTLRLLNLHATVSVCHTKTQDLAAVLKKAEVIFVGIGDREFIKAEHLGQNQIIIDAGINYLDGQLAGDVDFKSVSGQVAAITPVPGGVGLLTTAVIFQNLMQAMKLQNL